MHKRKTSLLRRAWLWDCIDLFCFEMAHKMAGFLVLLPLFRAAITRMLHVSAIDLLSRETLMELARNPQAALFCLLWLLLFVYYFYFETAVLALFFERAWQRERVPFSHLLTRALYRSLGLLHPKNAPLLLCLILALPLLSLPFSGTLGAGGLSDFILTIVGRKAVLYGLYALLVVGMLLLQFQFFFGFHAMIVRGQGLPQAWRSSRELMQGKKLKTAFSILKSLVPVSACLLLLYLLAVGVTAGEVRLQYSGIEARSTFQLHYLSWSRIARVAGAFGLSAWYFLSSTWLVHRLRGEKPHHRTRLHPHKKKTLRTALVLLLLLAVLSFSGTQLGNTVFYRPEERIQVVAHRGGAALAPENTIAALKEAIRNGSDQAEVDVQQTRDRVLILLHDSDLKRIAGVDQPVWEMTYNEIRQLKLSEPIPTLEEALKATDGKLDLMIELKVTGHETALVQKTMGLVRRYKAESRCIIGSMDQETLKAVKRIDPDMETVYITSLYYAERYNDPEADGYSVKNTFLTHGMANKMREDGKSVYAWTCNTERSIRRAIRCEPDGIITDNPYLVQYYLKYGDENLMLEFWRDRLFPLSGT